MSPSPLELFCDRSLGRHKVPDRLRAVHPSVIAHDDVFAQDTDDEVWLVEAALAGGLSSCETIASDIDRVNSKP